MLTTPRKTTTSSSKATTRSRASIVVLVVKLTMIAVATKEPASPQMQNFDVPVELSDLIMELLEKEPARRPLSALGVAETLQQIERQLRGEAVAPTIRKKTNTGPSTAVPAAIAEPSAAKRQDKQKLPWLLIAGAVAAVLLCLVLTLVIAGLTLFR